VSGDDTETMQRPDGEGRRRRAAGEGLVLVFAPPPAPARVVLASRTSIFGRDPPPGGVVVAHGSASRLHARLTPSADGAILTDLGSRNGTLVRGRRISEARLVLGDDVRIGDALYVYVDDAAAFAESAPKPRLPAGCVGGPRLARALEGLSAIAVTDLPVLVRGATGTGKELVARAVHDWSGRSGKFAAVNCAAIPSTLLESELFGARKGAFTGADRDRLGWVRTAHGGTLLLDEIGDLPLDAQAKLLRMIETREVVPLGASSAEKVDVRLVAATHRDLGALVGSGAFRGDLLARLMGFSIELPPLVARKEDLPALLAHVLGQEGRADLRPTLPFMIGLLRWDWPFNVRELRTVIRRAVALATARGGHELTADHLPEPMRAALLAYGEPVALAPLGDESPASATLPPPISPASEGPRVPRPRDRAPSASTLAALLSEHGGNVAQVARALGKDRAQIHRWMKAHALDPNAYRPAGEPPEPDGDE
jgi:DNA-binding NtrC family response regulator